MTKSDGRISVEQTVREIWATRPYRPDAESKIGGVAAGLGRRYDIDPVLVRVAFVVATVFSGVGLLLYLLGWLLLPAEGDEVSAAESLLGRGHSSMSPTITVLLGLALIPAVGFGFGQQFTGLIGLAVAGAALVVLHRSRSELGEVPPRVTGTAAPGTATTAAAPGTGTPPGDAATGSGTPDMPASGAATSTPAASTPATSTPAGSTPAASRSPGGAGGPTSAQRPEPPAWDPLGAAPFAWDLPEPGPPPPQAPPAPPPPRSKVTAVTLGLALVVGAIASAFWPALSLVQIAAAVLAVVGLGLVTGALVRGGRGLIGVALALVLLVWVLAAMPMSRFSAGERHWTPPTAAELQPRYELTVGNGELDLTGLRPAEGQTLRTAVAVGVGEARVVLPADVDARVSCEAPVGAVDCLGVTNSGVPARSDVTDPGTGGTAGGTLVLEVRSGIGNVSVTREP